MTNLGFICLPLINKLKFKLLHNVSTGNWYKHPKNILYLVISNLLTETPLYNIGRKTTCTSGSCSPYEEMKNQRGVFTLRAVEWVLLLLIRKAITKAYIGLKLVWSLFYLLSVRSSSISTTDDSLLTPIYIYLQRRWG